MKQIYVFALMLLALVSCKNDTEILSFEMRESELTMQVGETYQLSAAISYSGPDINIEWLSSDSVTVSVDSNGNLLAKQTGEASVTAKCLDQERICAVTVIPAEIDTPADSVPQNSPQKNIYIK